MPEGELKNELQQQLNEALFTAVKLGDLQKVNMLLTTGAEAEERALIWARQHGHKEIAAQLYKSWDTPTTPQQPSPDSEARSGAPVKRERSKAREKQFPFEEKGPGGSRAAPTFPVKYPPLDEWVRVAHSSVTDSWTIHEFDYTGDDSYMEQHAVLEATSGDDRGADFLLQDRRYVDDDGRQELDFDPDNQRFGQPKFDM